MTQAIRPMPTSKHECERCQRLLPVADLFGDARPVWINTPYGADKDINTFYRCRNKAACDTAASIMFKGEF